MRVYFTQYVSQEILDKFDTLTNIQKKLDDFFGDKSYGTDVEIIGIGVVCMHPRFADFFPVEKPKYNRVGKKHPHDDGSTKPDDRYLSFSITLDYNKYLDSENIRTVFPQDVLTLMDIISTIKQVKDFDLAKFKSDFEAFFKSIGWI